MKVLKKLDVIEQNQLFIAWQCCNIFTFWLYHRRLLCEHHSVVAAKVVQHWFLSYHGFFAPASVYCYYYLFGKTL